MGPFGMPDVLFAVFAEDGAGGGDEVSCVVEGVVLFLLGCVCSWFGFDDGPWDDVDV